jgi:DUF1680 family protein
MRKLLARREFLKTGSMAAGLAAYGASAQGASADSPPAASTAATVKIGATPYTPVGDYPIQPQRYSDVAIRDRFWAPRLATNAGVTIPVEVRKLAAAPRGLSGNVLEAAILSLKTQPDAEVQAQVDAAVQRALTAPARGNNGFEVAATYYHVTGKRDLLDQAIHTAHDLYEDFSQHDPPFSGGERDAINCVQLYRATHDKRHLDLAKHYLDIRGLATSAHRSRHNQSYRPVLEQRDAVGHAVNGVTLMVSLADVGVLTGLTPYLAASQRLWADAVSRKMYITGGVGTTGNEGFGEPYVLPNLSAYAETCAVLMFMTLNQRLFMATGDSQYIDVMERGMYNNALDGVSVSGDHFFYVNRLASAGDGRDARWARASLECCPPNLVRFMASMPGFIYAQDTRTQAIYVNLYVSSATTFFIGPQQSQQSQRPRQPQPQLRQQSESQSESQDQQRQLTLTVESEMPWGGKTRLAIATPGSARVRAAIKLRVPGWARNRPAPGGLYRYADALGDAMRLSVNDKPVVATPDHLGYVTLDRDWANGDLIALDLPIATRRVLADDRVAETRRRVAIERGPIVFCAEWPDVEGGKVLDLLLDRTAPLDAAAHDSPLGPGVAIATDVRRINQPQRPAARATLVPYHRWANRGVGEMSVWISTAGYAIGDIGPAGGFIFYENPNYASDGWRYLEAAPFDQSAGATWGCFRRLIDGATGTAIGSGRQNTADMLAACTDHGSAAQLCADLNVTGVRGWFLPSRDELAMLYRHLHAAGLGRFAGEGFTDNVSYWASSQRTADMASHIDFADLGRQHEDDKDFPRRVRAIRMI